MIIGMIIILLRFDGGSTEEEHDIAHIASSITLPAPRVAGFFLRHRQPRIVMFLPAILMRNRHRSFVTRRVV